MTSEISLIYKNSNALSMESMKKSPSPTNVKTNGVDLQTIVVLKQQVEKAIGLMGKGKSSEAQKVLSALQGEMKTLTLPLYITTQVERIKKDSSSQSVESASFLLLYYSLLQKQKNMGVHPFFAKEHHITSALEGYMELFQAAPVEQRKKTIHQPLFPEKTTFESIGCTMETTKPIYYVALRGDMQAMQVLEPYLESQDYLCPGHYGYTLMHLLLRGMDGKGCDRYSSLGTDAVVEFAKFLIQKQPALATQRTECGTTPLDYALLIRRNLLHLKELNRYEDHRSYIPAIEKIIELLKPFVPAPFILPPIV